MKTCGTCLEPKPVAAFYVRGDGRLHSECKDCKKDRSAAWAAANPAHNAIHRRKAASAWKKRNPDRTAEYVKTSSWRLQGIDPAEARRALAQHEGSCELCGATKPGGKGAWHVDHDHAAGRVRGVLCSRCNLGLGLVDRVGLPAIEQYLRQASSGPAAKNEAVPPLFN